jgi:hypothetical protein
LLEQHHQQLADIVRNLNEPPRSHADDDNATQAATTSEIARRTIDSKKPTSDNAGSRIPSPVRSRRPARDITSSIASNLASARGIPSQAGPESSRQSSPVAVKRQGGSNARRQPPVPNVMFPPAKPTSAVTKPVLQSASGPPSEDSFNKFYSTFEGIMSKISAPLAFAGLPLNPEEPAHPSKSPSSSHPARSTVISDDAAMSRIFSRAALRAVKDSNGPSGIHESFYVVPTSGGTTSYAGIMSHDQASRHTRNSSAASDAPEKFVDAPETPLQRGATASGISARPGAVSRNSKNAPASITPLKKTLEELELENQSLKALADKLSHRLYDWEKNSQNQSMALQQSIRNLRPPQSLSTAVQARRPPKEPSNMTTLQEEQRSGLEIVATEEALALAQKDLEKYGRENEKLKNVVMRYRERWEKLKEGARVRREGAEKERERREDDMKDSEANETEEGEEQV